MVKKIGLLVTVVIIVCILLYIIPFRHKINTTLEGLQCRIGDASYSEEITITVQGNYFSYLFKDDRFEGKILVDKYDYTLDGSWVFPLQFTDGWTPLIYHNNKDGKPVQNALGSIYCTPAFRQVLICVYEPIDGDSKGWDSKKGLFISIPAKTRSQAVNITKNLSKRNEGISLINWN